MMMGLKILETFFDDDGFKNLSLNNTDDEYIAVLEIPEIDLQRGLYESNSKLNNVDKNIEILKGSVLPNFNGGNLYLAAHSGNSNVSFFKNLDKLFIDDIIFVYYNNYKYIYVIDDIYEEIKRGYINVKLNGTNCGIVLTTCDTNNNNYQLIIKGKLIDREKY